MFLDTVGICSDTLPLTYRSLIPHFAEDFERCSSLADLNLENCELSCDGVTELLNTLSTFKGPLKSLSLADNFLGRFVWLTLM